VRKIDLTIPAPTVTAVKSDETTIAKGRALMDRIQQAVGGLAKLAALKDSITVADYLIDHEGKVTPIRQTERWIAPAHYRQDNEIAGGTISSYFDGQFGWITVPGGSVALAGPTLKQSQGNLFRVYALLLQAGSLKDTAVNAVDDRTVEVTGAAGERARLAIDPQTGLPVKLRYEGAATRGPAALTEETWSDFREVSGIEFPFKVSVTEGGRKYADVTYTEVRFNSGLKLADLEKRP